MVLYSHFDCVAFAGFSLVLYSHLAMVFMLFQFFHVFPVLVGGTVRTHGNSSLQAGVGRCMISVKTWVRNGANMKRRF